jgi:hypothetical protein
VPWSADPSIDEPELGPPLLLELEQATTPRPRTKTDGSQRVERIKVVLSD